MIRIASVLRWKAWYPYPLLILLGLATYGWGVSTPAVFGDDWQVLKGAADGTWHCPQWDFVRPLTLCWPLLPCRIAGLNVIAYNIASLVANLLAACLLYAIVVRLLPDCRVVALAAASLFLVYPSEYTHNWISASNQRASLVLCLLSALLLLHFSHSCRWWAWVTSIVALVLSLGIYEYVLGVALGGSLALAALHRGRAIRHRLALLAPACMALAFALWRTVGQRAAGIEQGTYGVELISLSPALIASRLVTGYRVNLQWAWTAWLLDLFPFLATRGPHVNLTASLVFAVGMLVLGVMAVLLARLCVRQPDDPMPWGRRPGAPRGLLSLLLGGLCALGLGYIPIGFVWGPTVAGYVATRINMVSCVGASIALAALLALLSLLIMQHRRRAAVVYACMVVPLVIIGGLTQVRVQQKTAEAWGEEQNVWRQIFRVLPNLADSTGVYLLTATAEDPMRPVPFMDGVHGAGFTAALSLFYGNDSLHGVSLYDVPELPEFTERGILRPWGLVPYHQVVMLEYDAVARELRLLSQVPERLLQGVVPAEPLGLDRILPGEPPASEFRRLVQ